MAKTLQSGAAKYDRKKATMTQAYAAGKAYAGANWNRGMTAFLGRPPRADRQQAYDNGYDPGAYNEAMSRTSGADWAKGVSDKM